MQTCHLCRHANEADDQVEFLGTVRGADVWRCVTCGSLFVPKTLALAERQYERLYISDEVYHTHWMRQRGYPPYKARFEHDYEVGISRMGKLYKVIPCGPLLDIGCSNGAFLRAAQDYGYVAAGVEVNREMVAYIVREHGLMAFWAEFPREMPKVLERSFRVVTLHDVLEHIQRPWIALHAVKKLLVEGGVIVVDTPNASSEDALTTGPEWKHVKPEEHPWLFSEYALKRLLASTGFSVCMTDHPIPGKVVCYASPLGSLERR